MKNIAVFGANRVVGKCVVELALDKDFDVRVLVIDPNQISKGSRERVDIVKGDVLNLVDVQTTLEGQDAAVVILEFQNNVGSTTLASEGWKNIIAVLEALRINVVSIFLSALQSNDSDTADSEYRRILKALDSSSLHWVVAKTYKVVDQLPSGYSVIRSGSLSRCSISKYDLAQFLVDSLSMPECYQKVVAVCSKTKRHVFQDVLNSE